MSAGSLSLALISTQMSANTIRPRALTDADAILSRRRAECRLQDGSPAYSRNQKGSAGVFIARRLDLDSSLLRWQDTSHLSVCVSFFQHRWAGHVD
jgi:hypothetical protein